MKFTVITCTYNASEVVERTLMSVLHQSYADIEHLIIDGASKDDTIAKVQKYADMMAEMQSGELTSNLLPSGRQGGGRSLVIVSERDKGLYDAMNKGIAKASGDYIIFLNAGDKFHSDDTLKKVAQSVISTPPLWGGAGRGLPPGVIYGDTNIVDDAGTFLRRRRLTPPEHLNWRSFRHGMLVCHQSFYARTDIARKFPYSMQYRFSADVDWCINVMHECDRQGLPLHNTHLTLTDYLDGGLSVKNHRASLIERFSVMAKHYGHITAIVMHIWFVIRAVMKK